jgi:hypothetical protein
VGYTTVAITPNCQMCQIITGLQKYLKPHSVVERLNIIAEMELFSVLGLI